MKRSMKRKQKLREERDAEKLQGGSMPWRRHAGPTTPRSARSASTFDRKYHEYSATCAIPAKGKSVPKKPARRRKAALHLEEELAMVNLLKLDADQRHPIEVRDLIDAVSYLVKRMTRERRAKLPF